MNLPEDLIQIVDTALADAVRRSGSWLACRPGCSQCCHGVFAISVLDASRLQVGLRQLAVHHPARAAAVLARATTAVARLSPDFPGNPATGILSTAPEAIAAFDHFANEDPCPALDPATQTCDLYAARPILCRTFGPPLQTPDAGLAVCELCFDGAAPEEIHRCQIDPTILDAEAEAERLFATRSHLPSTADPPQTIIAFALTREPAPALTSTKPDNQS